MAVYIHQDFNIHFFRRGMRYEYFFFFSIIFLWKVLLLYQNKGMKDILKGSKAD